MSANVLLRLLNEIGEKIRCEALPQVLTTLITTRMLNIF